MPLWVPLWVPLPRMATPWKSTLQYRSPDEYRAALRAEYARLGDLRDAELLEAAESRAAGAQHDEHGLTVHTEQSARPGGWKARHTNDVPDDPACGMTEEEKFTCVTRPMPLPRPRP